MPPVTTIAPSYQEDGVVIYHDDFARVLPMLPAGSVDFVLIERRVDSNGDVPPVRRYTRAASPLIGAVILREVRRPGAAGSPTRSNVTWSALAGSRVVVFFPRNAAGGSDGGTEPPAASGGKNAEREKGVQPGDTPMETQWKSDGQMVCELQNLPGVITTYFPPVPGVPSHFEITKCGKLLATKSNDSGPARVVFTPLGRRFYRERCAA